MAMRDELRAKNVLVDIRGPGQHAPAVKRMNQTIKESVRGYWNCLRFCMNRKILMACVMFAIFSINNQVSATSVDQTSPREVHWRDVEFQEGPASGLR